MRNGTASCFPVPGRNEHSPMRDSAEAPAALLLSVMTLESWRFPSAFVLPAVLKPYGCLIIWQPQDGTADRRWLQSPLVWGDDESSAICFGAFLQKSSRLVCSTCPLWPFGGPVKCICTLHVKCTPTCFLRTRLSMGPLYISLLSKTWSSGRICAAAHCGCSPLLFWKKA